MRTTCGLLAVGLVLACQAEPGENDGFDFGPGEESGDGAGDGADDGSDDGDDDGADGQGDGADDGADAGDDGADDGGEPDEDVPHARGTIVISETHAVGGSAPTPSVSATFVPDFQAAQNQLCAQAIGTCEVVTAPVCETACGVGEVCGWDTSCQASCQTVCDLACGVDEECYFPVPGSPACKKVEEFDAGALTFSGTTVPVTLYPPYAFVGEESGSLFLPGGELTVVGSGGAGAGFDPFQAAFTATDYLASDLDVVDPADAYGVGHLPVSWQAGEDEIVVTAIATGNLGSSGVITCKAIDSNGEYDIPRPALSAAVNDEVLSTVQVTIERRRTTMVKGLATHGNLTGQTVQPVGWLELVTSSSETTMIQDCGSYEWCSGECVDTYYDEYNCGGCGITCLSTEYCSAGSCI